MTTDTFKQLIDKYHTGGLSTEEQQMLAELLHAPEQRAVLEQLFAEDFSDTMFTGAADAETLALAYQRIRLARDTDNPVAGGRLHRLNKFRWLVAASLIVLLGTGAWWFASTPAPTVAVPQVAIMQHDVPAPQGNKAILTLSDGSTVPLDSVRQGTLATQGNARIIKRADGQIAYNTAINSLYAIATYNTLTVPRGSQPVQLVLADGSHVWLNVASSITYPTTFTGASRNVQLKGEGYFEIAHDAGRPFTVETAGIKVQVLGTQFNIMAYDDEAGVQTTLVQGSVKIKRGNTGTVIKPGEQAVPDGSHEGFTVRNANLEEVLAWKNGYFFFQDADLPVLLRQFARWYNIDINYQGQPRTYEFVGKLPRTARLSSALKLLEVNDIPFRFENNRLTIQQ